MKEASSVARWERDHWSRNSVPGMIYLVAESVRELLGPSRVLGNHIVLDLGDHVQAGQLLGNCGNSGNSTEPHVRFQLMDRPSVLVAAGLPFRFTGIRIDEDTPGGVPAHGRPFVTATT